MWFRGRTVLAFIALTAVTVGVITYTVLKFPELMNSSSDPTAHITDFAPEKGLNEEEFDKLSKAFELIRNRYILTTERDLLIDGAIQGMVEVLGDPYSIYKSQEEAENFTSLMQGAFTGIGAELIRENNAIIVQSPIRGSPAERAGLQPRDVILSVNGQSLQGLTLSEAIELIRGPKGTKAKLKVQRAGASDPLDLELVRDLIDPETVSVAFAEDGVGYIGINQFTFETAEQVATELKKLEKEGLKALIIDVRDNPGGVVQVVEAVTELFVVKGMPIMQYEYRDGSVAVELSEKGIRSNKPYPIIVLINKGSASAAEILAGALKQSANAVLLGEQTYGKGTVQVPYNAELGDGSLVKLTVSKWLLPDGTWVNGIGIEPDIVVAQPDYFLASLLPRNRVLKYDDTGEAVGNLQIILKGVGLPVDRYDGYFSQATELALQKFQQQEKLQVTGDVNEETAQRLEEVLYGIIRNTDNDQQLQSAYLKARDMIRTNP